MEEVNVRKEVINHMADSLLKHEHEEQDMASKLTLLKNQMMESNMGLGMDRRFSAVKIELLRNTVCAIKFEESDNEFFMIIDSKAAEVQINCENIDSLAEEAPGRVQMVYHLPQDRLKANTDMARRTDSFECAEAEMLLTTFQGIRNRILGVGNLPHLAAHKFSK